MSNKFPKQIKYIVGNEAAERYSYYGMRSILVIFMVQYLMIDKANATSIYHLFAGACYLLPIAGAFISDRILGKYKTIISLSLVYCLGHLVLALWENQMGLYWGLGLIAVGSGGIKPCVSAHVGDQFDASEGKLLKKVFDLFYWMINFGSFFASIITPWTLPKFGPGVAFGIPGILMAMATFVFWLGKKHYIHVPPTGKDPHGMIPVLVSAAKNRNKEKNFLDGALKNHKPEHIDAVRSVWGIAKIFFLISIFWALFDQHGSTWVLQAKEMNLNFLGFALLPSQIPALNPIMVMALIPITAKYLFPFLENRGLKITPLRKMGAEWLLLDSLL
jgi:POT family proton-dependent oligopeptide transporter